MVVASQGFEPQFSVPETDVLPLNYEAICFIFYYKIGQKSIRAFFAYIFWVTIDI